MAGLADSCANLLNSYQSSLTLTQIDEEIIKEQDSEDEAGVSFGIFDDTIKKLQ